MLNKHKSVTRFLFLLTSGGECVTYLWIITHDNELQIKHSSVCTLTCLKPLRTP